MKQSKGYAISYRGPIVTHEGRVYEGLWAVPGDVHWRSTKAVFETAYQAEAGAGNALCLYLNCELYPTFNRLSNEGSHDDATHK